LYGSGHSAGALTAWAWGVDRVIDALEATPGAGIDPKRVGVTGAPAMARVLSSRLPSLIVLLSVYLRSLALAVLPAGAFPTQKRPRERTFRPPVRLLAKMSGSHPDSIHLVPRPTRSLLTTISSLVWWPLAVSLLLRTRLIGSDQCLRLLA
jgi:hypothetical protein